MTVLLPAYTLCMEESKIFIMLCFLLKVLGYVKLAVEEGGTIECGEGKDIPLDIPSPYTKVHKSPKLHT